MTTKFDPAKDQLNHTFDYNVLERNALNGKLNNKTNFDAEDLYRVARWKIDRVLCIPAEVVDALREFVRPPNLDPCSPESHAIITRLDECDGIGVRMASAILKFLRPDKYPIMDVRAARALYGEKLKAAQFTVDRYITYIENIEALRGKIAAHTGNGKPDLDVVDEQLYMFDKAKNGKI